MGLRGDPGRCGGAAGAEGRPGGQRMGLRGDPGGGGGQLGLRGDPGWGEEDGTEGRPHGAESRSSQLAHPTALSAVNPLRPPNPPECFHQEFYFLSIVLCLNLPLLCSVAAQFCSVGHFAVFIFMPKDGFFSS